MTSNREINKVHPEEIGKNSEQSTFREPDTASPRDQHYKRLSQCGLFAYKKDSGGTGTTPTELEPITSNQEREKHLAPYPSSSVSDGTEISTHKACCNIM